MAVVTALRPAHTGDVALLLEIERESFSDVSWQAETFLHYDCVVAEVDCQIAGFLVSWENFHGGNNALPEREILNLAVAPQFRRMGIATELLAHELRHAASFFLEVRESNAAARALYRKLGFIEVGSRPDYYRGPNETAIVMHLK
jgi:ribosomal-protein-alanine N-acetyltransferase